MSEVGHEIVAESGSPERLIQSAREVDPQLVVLACSLEPFSPGPEIAMLRTRLHACRIVIVASGPLGRSLRKLVLAEADGVVHDSDLEQALPATVNCVGSNHLCVPSSAREALAQPVFSHREKQVLELVLAGLTNGEIAGRLFLSESTVKSHLASTFRKLGVSSRAEVAQRLVEYDCGFDPSWQPTATPSLPRTPELV